MQKQLIHTKKAGGTWNKTIAQAVRVRAQDLVFVTGQVANEPGTDHPEDPLAPLELGTIEEQTTRVLENIKAILEEAGTDLAHIVKRNVYLTHTSDYGPVCAVMERYFPQQMASTAVLTSLIPSSARVEIDVVAVVPE